MRRFQLRKVVYGFLQRGAARIVCRQLVIVLEQGRQQHVKCGQMGVVACGNQAVQGHALDILQHLHGVNAARVLALDPGVDRVVLAFGACRARRREGPVIGVLDPPGAGIAQRDRVLESQGSVPFGGRVAAIDRAGVIKFWIPLGNEVAVKIGNRAVRVGVHRVVGSVGAHLLSPAESGVVRGLGAQVGLFQRGHRVLQQLDGDPTIMLGADDGPVMAVIHGELSRPQSGAQLVGYGDLADPQFLQAAAIPVVQAVRLLDDGLGIFVDGVAAVRGVHPAVARVESLVDEELAPRDRAVHIQSRIAHHLQFGTKIV